MKRLSVKKYLILCIVLHAFVSCDMFNDSTNYDADEPIKDIVGSWYITKVTRNGLDITKMMDFSNFRINLMDDNTYTIDNYLPFLVRRDGIWHVNDFQYPTKLIFREEASTEPNTSSFEYQTVKGERQITLSFSPGCNSNVYSYVLKKPNN